MEKWVVLERRELPKTSRLKCLRCGWKWWSKRRYSSKLPDHVERRVSSITDECVLARLREGTLQVNLDRPAVRSYDPVRRCWRSIHISTRVSNGGPPYRFVVIYKIGRKKVALHRLVWMAAHMRVVPPGYDVDHRQHGIKNPDAIGNLRLLPSAVNRSRGTEEPW